MAADVPARRAGHGPQLALLALAVAAGGFARMALSPVQEAVRIGLSLSDNQIATLQGLAPALPIVLFSAPLGVVVDRGRRTLLLMALMALAAGGTALSSFAPNFAVLFAARMMVGLGVAGALPAAISLAADLFAPHLLGRVNMTLAFGQTAGAALAFVAGGALLDWTARSGAPEPWRAALLGLAAPLIAISGVCLMMREPPRQGVEIQDRADAGQSLRELIKYLPVVGPLVIGMVAVSMTDAASSIWATPVLVRGFHLSPAAIGAMMGAVVMVGGVAGVVAGGLLADLGQKLDGHRGVMWVATGATAISIPFAAFPVAPSVPAVALALAGLLLCGAAIGVATTTAFTLAIPNELRGVAIGLVISTSAIVSTAIAPSAVSLLSQAMGGPAHLAAALAAVGVAASACGTAAFAGALTAVPAKPPGG